MEWKILKKETAFRNKWRDISKWTVRVGSGETHDFYIDNGKDVVEVLIRTVDGKFVILDQYYIGSERKLISLVAGMKEKGETPRQAAVRELLEETGYTARKMISLGSSVRGKYNVGKNYYFLALDATKTKEPDLEPSESLSSFIISQVKLVEYLKKYKIEDFYDEVCVFRALIHLGIKV